MIAFDTNVLVRVLVADDEAQTARAVEVLEEIGGRDEQCHLPDAVLSETAWVLKSAYGASKVDLVTAFTALVDDARYHFEDPDSLREVIQVFKAGKGDFADYLIGSAARCQGASTTYTFDRKLRDDQAFTILR